MNSKKAIKVIYVNSCVECPFYGKCKAWTGLSKKDKVYITISTSVPKDFILKNCHLEDL